jgi:hypothetical protein
MRATAILRKRAARTGSAPVKTLPDPMPRAPGRAPAEPIIIKDPQRPPEVPEIDRPLDEEDEPEIEKLPPIIPDKPPPPAPWERALTKSVRREG